MKDYNKKWMGYINKEVRLEEEQQVHNKKFERINERAQVAYKNKAMKKEATLQSKSKPVIKKEV
jgi:hydroxyacyl-ACP dehydratase HTD2-like protein with hotdog domain